MPAILMGTAAFAVVLVLVAAGAFVVARKQGASTASGGTVTTETETTYETTEARTTETRTRTTTSSTPTTTPPPTGPGALGQNPLYSDFSAGLAKQPCNPVGWPSDASAAEAFYQGVLPCLNTAWNPLVTAAGLGFHGATVLVPTGTVVVNPCGTTTVGYAHNPAFYCPTNETLYMPLAGMPPEKYGDKAIIYLSMIAHEYGHHVQQLTGTSAEEWSQAKASGEGSAVALELSRRLELQAQCFSGMFVSAIVDSGGRFTPADYAIALDDAQRGDWHPDQYPRDHGTPAHAQAWWNQGYEKNEVGECNTWLASSDGVS